MKKLKVMTIFGTRPEIIRLSRVLSKLDKFTKHITVYTNQSYSSDLKDVFFSDLKIRKPNYELSVKSDTLGEQIGKIISQSEKIIIKEKPDAILILGDTNSSLASIIAKRLKVPIFHMEAGNRSFDWNVPEEVNRRIVDHISDFNLPYTEHARRYLLAEGIKPETVFVTGSPLAEIIEFYKDKIETSLILKKLKLKINKYFAVSVHREDNVDKAENIMQIFESLNYLAETYHLPIIVSVHPRTDKNIKKMKMKFSKFVKFNKPFGFFDYNKLQQNAFCVLSDSGTIQEESAILGFKAIQIRNSTERPEAFDSGSIILTGIEKNSIANAVNLVTNQSENQRQIPKDYNDKNVSSKVVRLILGFGSIAKNNK